jgi:head-tail adaptor
LSVGQLRERLTFQSPSPVDDGMGNYTEGWSDEFTVWARLQPRVGGETVLAARLAGRQVYMIVVRQSSDTLRIQPDWQAVDARDTSRVFQIKSPSRNVDEKNAYLEIDAEYGVAA